MLCQSLMILPGCLLLQLLLQQGQVPATLVQPGSMGLMEQLSVLACCIWAALMFLQFALGGQTGRLLLP